MNVILKVPMDVRFLAVVFLHLLSLPGSVLLTLDFKIAAMILMSRDGKLTNLFYGAVFFLFPDFMHFNCVHEVLLWYF